MLLLFLVLCFISVHAAADADFDVDVVFTWKRQPSDDALLTIASKYCLESHGHKITRFRETGTLEYAIHAATQNMQWVRKIYIVTNDERPCWLGSDNSNIIIISHKQIWPTLRMGSDLPTFNSIAIETHLHRIPGLSEHFIYLNDDMFVGKPLPKSYFFHSGRPLVSLNPSDRVTPMTDPAKVDGVGWPQAVIGTHGPYVARKSTIEKVQSTWTKYFEVTSSSRCRSPGDTQSKYKHHVKPPFWVYNWYGLATNTSAGVVTGVLFMDTRFTPSKFYKSLLASPVAAEFFTLNDDFSADPVEGSRGISKMLRFLASYFSPYPSSYPKDFRACGLQVDKGLVDIPRANLSAFALSRAPAQALNAAIQSTLSSAEVGHWDEFRQPNTLEAQGSGMELLRDTDAIRVTYFNAERGTKWPEQCEKIRTHPSLKDSAILFFNELDVGMARSGNGNTALQLATCLQMNYAYGIEFVELTLGQQKEIRLLPQGAINNRSFRGNAIFSKFPLRNVEVHQLPGTAEYWHTGGKTNEPRLGERMALFASVPVQRSASAGAGGSSVAWIDLVSTHLDAFVGESYNIKSVRKISDILNQRNCDGAIVSGDLGNRGTTLAESASWLHAHAGFLDPLLSNTMNRAHKKLNPKGDWILFRANKNTIEFQPMPESIQVVSAFRLSDHNFVTVKVKVSPAAPVPFPAPAPAEVTVADSPSHREQLRRRLAHMASNISFADRMKQYSAMSQNGAGEAVSHQQVVAMGHISPLESDFAPTPEDLQLRRVLSREYHAALEGSAYAKQRKSKDQPQPRPPPLTVTVLALVGDRRRALWTKEAIPLVCTV
jgi:endonuclease/exonuclease/phosphatase family metal-dependent hydrolase